jgi:hypothetical protein
MHTTTVTVSVMKIMTRNIQTARVSRVSFRPEEMLREAPQLGVGKKIKLEALKLN